MLPIPAIVLHTLIVSLTGLLLLVYTAYTALWLTERVDRLWWLHLVDYFRHVWPWLGVAILAALLYWKTPFSFVPPPIQHGATVWATLVLAINLFISLRYGVGLQRLPQPFRHWFSPKWCQQKPSLRKIREAWQTTAEDTQLDKDFHLISLNLSHANKESHRVRNYLGEQHADVVCVQEYTDTWRDELDDPVLRKLYPYQTRYNSALKPDAGMAILSRWPFAPSTETLIEVNHSTIQGITVLWQQSPLHVVNFHPEATVTPAKFGRQKQHWRALKKLLDSTCPREEPLLIVGDFNVCPWSPMLANLREEFCLTDAQSDWGIQPTFPMPIPIVVIDNALGSLHWQWVDIRRGRPVGSDHLPLVIRAHPVSSANSL